VIRLNIFYARTCQKYGKIKDIFEADLKNIYFEPNVKVENATKKLLLSYTYSGQPVCKNH